MSEIIKTLVSSNFQIKCPKCGEVTSTRYANLFDIREDYPTRIKNYIKAIIKRQKSLSDNHSRKIKALSKKMKEFKIEQTGLKDKIKNKPKRIRIITKHVNIGQIIEKIIPGSRSFKFEQKDCRAIFDPIDYIAFNGLTKNKNVDSITFIEIKSGDATLQRNQKNIRKQLENNHVKYLEY